MPPSVAQTRRLLPALIGLLFIGGAALGAAWWVRRPAPSPLETARAAYDRRDWPAADKAAREHLKSHHDDVVALRLLARSLYRQGYEERAAEVYNRVEQDQLEAEDHFLMGQTLKRQDQHELAMVVLRKALELDPNHVESLLALEQVLFRVDKLEEATRIAKILARQPRWGAYADLLLGRICAEHSDPVGAAQAYTRALARAEEWSALDTADHVRKELARSLLRTEQPALARSELRKRANANDDPETSWLVSRCDLQEGIKSDARVLALGQSYRNSHLVEPEPAAFVGEAQCALCHPLIFQAQHASRHARTFLRAQQSAALAVPKEPVADPGDSKVMHSFQKTGSELDVKTRVGGSVFETIVDYAFGSGDRGLTLVGHDQQKRSFEYRLSYYAPPVGWDVTAGHPVHENLPAWVYQGMPLTVDSVRRCLFCHATSPHAVMTGSGAEASDKAIGCERCHGPGGNHLKAVAIQDADLAIARPALESGPPIVRLCAGCHSPRGDVQRLSPGADDSVRFQGTTLTWSRCYTESGNSLDCVSCHNPHRNVETRKAWYESRCLQCHSSSGSPDAATKRRALRPRRATDSPKTSCPVEPTQGCINCHMPKLKTQIAHSLFTDHFIRVRPGT